MERIVYILNIIVGSALVLFLFLIGNYFFKNQNSFTYIAAQESSYQNTSSQKKEINILILGRAGAGNDAPYLTDSIMLANINMASPAINLISIPRDLLVTDPNGSEMKINALYEDDNLNPDWVENKVKEITGITPNYYFVIDLNALKTIIDDMGGVKVDVPQALYDPAYPGPNDSYTTYSISAGWHNLTGSDALEYIRTRHENGGDLARMKRQRQLIEAILQKFHDQNIFWSLVKITQIYNGIMPDINTNVSMNLIAALWQFKDQINTQNIHTYGVDNYINEDQIILGGQESDVIEPKAGMFNYSDIQTFIGGIIHN